MPFPDEYGMIHFDHFGRHAHRNKAFDGGAFERERKRIKAAMLEKAAPKPIPVDPSTIEPAAELGLAEIRAKLIEYVTADPKTLVDFDKLESYNRDSFIVRKKSFHAFAGIEFLGSGCYSDVYALDDKRALKVVKARDSGYARFAEMAMKNQDNPHLPRFYYSGVWADKTVYVFERLEVGNPHGSVSELFRSLVRDVSRGDAKPDEEENPFLSIPASVYAVGALLKDMCNDLHSGNVMFRGNVPVVTDPSS